MKQKRANAKDKEKEMAMVSPAQHKQYIDNKRQKERERSKRYRQRKKMQAEQQQNAMAGENVFVAKSYSNRATLGKAKKKVERALPESPTRKKAVLVSIFKEMDDGERNELVSVISSKPSTITSNTSTKFDKISRDIGQFYERDDISRVSPKIKDVQQRKDVLTGAVDLLPKRHMVVTIKEAYALFIEDRNAINKGIKIKAVLCIKSDNLINC